MKQNEKLLISNANKRTVLKKSNSFQVSMWESILYSLYTRKISPFFS